MRNFNLNRLLVSILVLLSMVSNSFTYAAVGSQPVSKEDIQRYYGPGSGISDVPVTDKYGVVTHYTRVTLCSLDGAVCASRHYRTTQTEAFIDGKSIRVETIDRGARGDYQISQKGPPRNTRYDRLNFKSSSVPVTDPKSHPGYGTVDMNAKVDLEINPYSEFYNEVSAVLPSVAVGIADAIKDMQASQAAAARLQEVYRQISEQTRRANDHLAENARRNNEAAQVTSGFISALTADHMGQSLKSSHRGAEFQDYLRVARDPLAFKEYELTPAALQTLAESMYEAAKNRQVQKALQYSEMLLSQKNPKERSKAAQFLNNLFKDGVLQTQAFGAPKPSILDRAKFKTPAHSVGGQVVRRMANKAQSTWLETRGLETMSDSSVASYVAALTSLRAADDSFSRGKTEAGLYLAEVASSLLDFSRGFGQGAFESVVGGVKAVPEVAKGLLSFARNAMFDDEAAVKQLWGFVKSIPGALDVLATHYLYLADQMAVGTPVQKGKAAGQIAVDVVLGMVTDGAIAGVRRAAIGSEIASVSSRIAAITGESAVIAIEEASKVASQFSSGQARSFLSLANSNPTEALNIMRATKLLSTEATSGAKEYLSIALGTSGRAMGAPSKAVQALTDAIHEGVISNTKQVQVAQALIPALEKMPHQVDFRLVGSLDKVALIGRDMKGNVIPVRDLLDKQGIKVETFTLSSEATEAWKKLKIKHGGEELVPLSEHRISLGYTSNKDWIQKLIDQGYTILDANNPGNYSWSLYYDELERGMLLKARGQ